MANKETFGQFANVDLSFSPTLERIQRRLKADRDALIEACAQEAESASSPAAAAAAIRKLKEV